MKSLPEYNPNTVLHNKSIVAVKASNESKNSTMYIILIKFIEKYRCDGDLLSSRSFIIAMGIKDTIAHIESLIKDNKYIDLINSFVISDNNTLRMSMNKGNNLSKFIDSYFQDGLDIVKAYIDRQESLPMIKKDNKLLNEISKDSNPQTPTTAKVYDNIDEDDWMNEVDVSEEDFSDQFNNLLAVLNTLED